MPDFWTVKDCAREWGIAEIWVRRLMPKLPTATKRPTTWGMEWVVPSGTPKPTTTRKKGEISCQK
jgi:hypothetical protein